MIGRVVMASEVSDGYGALIGRTAEANGSGVQKRTGPGPADKS